MERARRPAAPRPRPTLAVLLGSLILAVAWVLRVAAPLDRRLGGAVEHAGSNPVLAAWEVVTETVTGPALLAGILLAVVMLGGARPGARLIVAQVLGGLAVAVGKALDPRLRPDGGDGSWPSGHTVSAVLLAVGLAAAWRRAGAAWWPRMLLLFAWSLAVGASRVALGRHWPTDVLAGFGVGLLVHAVSGLGGWSRVGTWLRPDVLRRLVVVGFVALAVGSVLDPFAQVTARAWAWAFLVFAWLRLERDREPSSPDAAEGRHETAAVAALAAGCALMALVGSGATELWTTGEARALTASGDGSLLGGGLRALGRAAFGAGSLAERAPAALGLGLCVPAVIGLAGAAGLRGPWRLGAGLVFASALGPLALAHLATDDAVHLAELLWMTWAVASLATPASRSRRVALWSAAGFALLDLAASAVWWAPCAACLGGGVVAARRGLAGRWIGAVAVAVGGAALGWAAWRGTGPAPAAVGVAFLPWWSGLLVARRSATPGVDAGRIGLVVAAWSLACAVLGGAESRLASVAVVPGLAIAATAGLARVDRSYVGGGSAGRRALLTAAVVATGLGVAIWSVPLWTDPAAALPPAPPLAVALVLWGGGGLVVARCCWRGESWLALRGLAVVSVATGVVLVASVWPFAMRGAITREVVHAAARFEVAGEVLLVGVDPGPLMHYLAPALVDAGGDDRETVGRMQAGGVGLLVDARRLDALRRAGLNATPTARFEGFVPHAWERQVWLWFAP